MQINSLETASEFIRRTADLVSIPIDFNNFANTNHKHNAKNWNKTSIYDVWKNLLLITMFEEEKIYHLFVTPKGITLEKIDGNEEKNIWVFEQTEEYTNLIEGNRTISAMDSRFANVVKAYYNEGNNSLISSIVSNAGSSSVDVTEIINRESVDRYGQFTTYIDATNIDDNEALVKRMQLIADKSVPTDTVEFTTYAINSIKPTDSILISSLNMQINGVYYIQDITTQIAAGSAWHSITATRYREVPGLISAALGLLTADSSGDGDNIAESVLSSGGG